MIRKKRKRRGAAKTGERGARREGRETQWDGSVSDVLSRPPHSLMLHRRAMRWALGCKDLQRKQESGNHATSDPSKCPSLYSLIPNLCTVDRDLPQCLNCGQKGDNRNKDFATTATVQKKQRRKKEGRMKDRQTRRCAPLQG